MSEWFIKPFTKAIENVLEMMLQLPCTFGEIASVGEMPPKYDVSGVIGMSGDVVGAVVVSFPVAAARNIVTKFTGMEMDESSDDFSDAIGELANMISGAAKADFGDRKVSISCPSVIIGNGHKVAQPSGVRCYTIPCFTGCGEFAVEVCIKDAPDSKAANAASGSATASRS